MNDILSQDYFDFLFLFINKEGGEFMVDINTVATGLITTISSEIIKFYLRLWLKPEQKRKKEDNNGENTSEQ